MKLAAQLGRRGLLKALSGLAGGAVMDKAVGGLRPSDLRNVPTQELAKDYDVSEQFEFSPGVDARNELLRRTDRMLERHMWYVERKTNAHTAEGIKHHMPVHISSKRSWSVAFKAGESFKEQEAMRQAVDALREEVRKQNQPLFEKLRGMFGEDEPTNNPVGSVGSPF